jgi:hypothetical protein
VLAIGLHPVLVTWTMPVQADVWAYVDTRGVAHFASEKLDERYELFFRAAESFDTRRIHRRRAGRATSVAKLPPPPPPSANKLLAFFDGSPTFKSVRQFLRTRRADHDIDFELLQALIAMESGFNASAVSPKGAIGLMQLMPDTARRYGVNTDRHGPLERKLTDPQDQHPCRHALPARPDQHVSRSARTGAGRVQRRRRRRHARRQPDPELQGDPELRQERDGLYLGLKPPAPPVAGAGVALSAFAGAPGDPRWCAQPRQPAAELDRISARHGRENPHQLNRATYAAVEAPLPERWCVMDKTPYDRPIDT